MCTEQHRTYSTVYDGYDEQERIMLIVEGVIEHLKTEKDIQEFKKALMNQFMAHGKYCRFEKCFFDYFNSLANINVQ